MPYQPGDRRQAGGCQIPPPADAEYELPRQAPSCYRRSSLTIADRALAGGRHLLRHANRLLLTLGINQSLLVLSSNLGLGGPGSEFDRNEHRKPSRSPPSDSSSQFLQLSDWFLQADRSSIPAPQPSSDVVAPGFSPLDPAHVDRVSRRLRTVVS